MELTGIELARAYYAQVVAPLLLARWPGLPHAGARLGSGSDVLRLDDAVSRDHDWGLRLTLLVDSGRVGPVDDYLADALPEGFLGLPTRFATTWSPRVRHGVEVATPEDFAASRLGVDVRGALDTVDWLSLTGQSVLEVSAGEVFADTHGGLTAIRKRLEWYPDDLWRYVLAADWTRIGKELPVVGRAGERGDDIGSRVVAARIARTIMHLGFLLERRWPPYAKWLGTLFAALPGAGVAAPTLERALAASDWRERESALGEALTQLHDLQDSLGLPADATVVERFYDRPFLAARGIPELLIESIRDPGIRGLPAGVGSIEQWVDGADVLQVSERRVAAARALR